MAADPLATAIRVAGAYSTAARAAIINDYRKTALAQARAQLLNQAKVKVIRGAILETIRDGAVELIRQKPLGR